MKAKHFKRIRLKARYFLVIKTGGLFGDFRKDISRFSNDKDLSEGVRVLAFNELQAAKRYCKRNFENSLVPDTETNSTFGRYRVVPFDMQFRRFVKYYF